MSNIYDAIIRAEAARTKLPFALIKAMIKVESNFNPKAFRREVFKRDASRGLMQVLYGTAKALEPDIEEDQLFEPEVCVRVGSTYLRKQVTRYHERLWHGVSAYNCGSARIVAEPTTVCLLRNEDGECIKYFNAVPGQFTNQPYVDRVKAAMKSFSFGDVEGGSSSA